jgi:signal transduction histidine kinase/integral membrane sensor domain MASE1
MTTIQLAASALAVSLSYYLGANLGLILRFPPATPSVMWPPNAILTATLLLTPPRRWWIFLLAALPAHLVAELGIIGEWPLVLALFVTNCSEALIAAVLVRRFSDAPGRFDTLHRVVAFVVGGGILAPFLSSFLDAGVVAALRGESYGAVWRARFFSNVLTELALVPAVVICVTAAPAWFRRASWRRQAEALLLGVMLLGFGIVLFTSADLAAIPGLPRSPLAFLLPLLLWAAVRFGPGGANLGLLLTVLVAIWAVTHGYGPFGDLPARESIPALQVLLSVMAIPLMCLAALIEERQRAEQALAERLRFEELLSRLSAAFVHLPSHEMDQAFETWLKRLGESLSLTRLMLLRVAENGHDGQSVTIAHRWSAPGAPAPSASSAAALSNGADWHRLLRDEPVPTPGRSDLVIPLVAGGRILGGLILDAVSVSQRAAASRLPELRLVAEVFAGALARKETEDALRASEVMKSAILISLNTGVAVLDRDGRIIAVNDGWIRLTHDEGAMIDAGVDDNYLQVCRARADEGVPAAGDALAGTEAVLARARASFALEYVAGAPPAERWFAMAVFPLNRPEGGAVVSQSDVTERRRAEAEAQRHRQELAHFTRVSAMGELTASLAHELSQPLSGILTNAQAAQRFLNMTPPALGELRDILADIVDDNKRAGEVIHGLRDLLRKRELSREPLELNELIRDVVRLLGSDAVIRNVTCTLELHAAPLIVIGDRAQLQQVVLNLVLNAMEAMVECDAPDRTIVVRTGMELDAVHVAVQDAGPGLADGAEQRIFEPFYTTKPAGMGMGLSIARSIVHAHGGLIWATRNPERGATFHLALPATTSVPA